ncbi:MAG: hypothetical protein JKX91_14845 [Rhizobiaceae bacterium]|nr:hypothetical protein [Rhizobiaceae bacterium]
MIFDLQWLPNLEGGYIDIDKKIMYREPPNAKKTKKRKPPIAIPYRLLNHMKRWHKIDSDGDAIIRHVVNYRGKRVYRINKSWHTFRVDAKLPEWVILHCLRHTSITWLMQSGKVDRVAAEGFYGVSAKVMEEVYLHHHPDHQQEIRRVF